MTKSDPTNEALGTIASILDGSKSPKSPRATEGPATASPPIAPVEADGYTKIGPGPMEAIRFRWKVRRGENNEYFVEEAIGEISPPVVIGPMTADVAVKLVDERESDARKRFEQIRSEMIGRGIAALDAASKDRDA